MRAYKITIWLDTDNETEPDDIRDAIEGHELLAGASMQIEETIYS